MKKLMNDAADYVDEALDGLCDAFDGYVRTGRSGRVITRSDPRRRANVGVASGGGFGHLPLFAGYVGDGMLDSCAVGNVFAGPPADICGEALRAAFVFEVVAGLREAHAIAAIVAEHAQDACLVIGGATATVIVADDIASASSAESAKRRGVAGAVFAFKVAGASAARGDALATAADLTRETVARTRSIGVALSPCLIPGADEPGFSVPAGKIEIGMGIHGEPGIEERALSAADEVTAAMVDRLLADGAGRESGRVALLVNSLGATPLEELLIVYRHVKRMLGAQGIEVGRRYVGHYASSMEMAGCSITLLDLTTDIATLLDASTTCPFWPRPQLR